MSEKFLICINKDSHKGDYVDNLQCINWFSQYLYLRTFYNPQQCWQRILIYCNNKIETVTSEKKRYSKDTIAKGYLLL